MIHIIQKYMEVLMDFAMIITARYPILEVS